ncbi:MAG TPA: GNAT family N-acetyltransferase [Chloroflexi bacterium]|nr:GNAT family N-acetyltransferase [Chloroflexota bacterium]
MTRTFKELETQLEQDKQALQRYHSPIDPHPLPPQSTGVWLPAGGRPGNPPSLADIAAELAAENLFRVVPASQYTIEQLTDIYNQTRSDYIVPMPMNADRLAEYIHVYDVDLEHSAVALDQDQPLGLGMLGVRPNRSWITRLGVMPSNRRRGVGETIFLSLLAASDQLEIDLSTLEVIKQNVPAHNLFLKWGFHDTRELVVLRRPPGPPAASPIGEFRWLDRPEALELAETRQLPLTWINDTPSLVHSDHVMGLVATLPDSSHGWVIFQKHETYLTRMTIETESGDPIAVGKALFASLYQRFPDVDTNIENVSIINPHILALFNSGFVETFRRIEMYRARHYALAQAADLIQGNASPGRILIVDDEENVAFALREGLKDLSNSQITVVTSGQEAWKLLEAQTFDLVVTDHNMPDLDGMTLAQRTRRLYPRTAIIIITAYNSETLREQAARASVEQVLDKPVGLAAIRSAASEALGAVNKEGNN